MMKKFAIIDDCTTKRASIYEKLFDSKNEATRKARAEWDALSEHDKAERDAYYVASCNIAENGCIDWESVNLIIEF